MEVDSGISGTPLESRWDEGAATATAREPPPQPDSHELEMWTRSAREGTQDQSSSGLKSAELLVARHARLQDAWDESRRTASAEEAKRGDVADPDTRPLDPSGSSMDLEPKRRTKTTSVTENLLDRMDEDNFRRTPATSHPLEPVDDENVSKKARVARNVLHVRGEDSVKFDVNEEAWPNADLAIHSSYEGALIDALPADKVKAGDEREIK